MQSFYETFKGSFRYNFVRVLLKKGLTFVQRKEKKFIKQIKNGNNQAFKQLYDRYAPYALRIAYAILKNKYDASDAVQETFIRVYRHIDTFDMTKSFRPWFYQILINESRRLITKRAKQAVHVESNEILDLLEHKKEKPKAAEDVMIALEYLHEDDRTILILKYLDNFTEKELAQIMNLKVNTVKTRLYRARKRVQSIMSGGNLDAF